MYFFETTSYFIYDTRLLTNSVLVLLCLDPERFWEESLPKKVERSARRAVVKVKQNWRYI